MSPVDKAGTSVGRLLDGRRRSLAVLSIASLIGGLAEALFLVVITRAAFAITEGKERFGVIAGRSLTVELAVVLALVLVVVRVAFALISGWLGSRLSSSVVAEVRGNLARAFIRSSWAVQQEQRSGGLQEMLTTFVNNGAALLSAVTTIITSGFNLLALLGLAIAVDPVGSLVAVVAVAVLGSVLRPVPGGWRCGSGWVAPARMRRESTA